MARKLVGPARKSSHNQSRTTPYQLPSQLPYRGPSVSFAEPQSGLRYRTHQVPQEVQRDFSQSLGLDPETSWSSSDGPATPDSPPISPVISPYLANASPELSNNQYPTAFDTETSCSDNLSGFVFVDQSIRSLEPFNYPSPQPLSPWSDQQQPFNILTPTNSTSSTLTGIQSSPEIDRFVHHVDFPDGPTPTRLQPLPQSQTPWVHHSLRQDELMEIDGDSTPPSASALSPALSIDRAKRRGPLTVDGRRNANKVRDIGACLRCLLMKEKCDDDGTQCSNCKNKKTRKWKLGCVRVKLQELEEEFFPPPLRNRYGSEDTNRYVSNSGFTYLEDGRVFMLRLDMGVGGPPLEVPVREVEPLEYKRIKRTFQVNTTSGSLEPRETWDPPVVPYLENKHFYRRSLAGQLTKSMQHVFARRDKDDGYHWPRECFDGLSCHWVRDVVELIHDFQQSALMIEYFRPIWKSQHVLYMNYILDHPLLVHAKEQQDHLFANITRRPDPQHPPKFIAPEAVIRFIKSVIFPNLRENTKELLATLHETLISMATAKPKDQPTEPQRDLVFSLSFMLLVIIGQTQARLLLLSEMSATQPDIDLPLKEAKEHIDQVERSLANYITCFHEFVYKRRPHVQSRAAPMSPVSPPDSSSPPAERHSDQFKLRIKVRELTLKYRSQRPESFQRGELSVSDFDKDNIHRICWRFVETMFST